MPRVSALASHDAGVQAIGSTRYLLYHLQEARSRYL
jgi:hypothetical protein